MFSKYLKKDTIQCKNQARPIIITIQNPMRESLKFIVVETHSNGQIIIICSTMIFYQVMTSVYRIVRCCSRTARPATCVTLRIQNKSANP